MRSLRNEGRSLPSDQQVIHAISYGPRLLSDLGGKWVKETDANGFYRAIGWKDAEFAELTKEIRSSIADCQEVKQNQG